jgi:hypothetical protein
VALTALEERVLVGLSLAATRGRLEHVARALLDRDDAVTALVRRLGANDKDAWREAEAVLVRRKGNRFNLLDLVVEVGQQERVRRGERTSPWRAPRENNSPER